MEHALSTPTPLHGYQTLPGTLSRLLHGAQEERENLANMAAHAFPGAYSSVTSYVVLSSPRDGEQGHPTSTIGPYALLSKLELVEVVA